MCANGPVQLDEMALVCPGGHHKPKAGVNNAFADDIVAQRALDVGCGGQGGTAQE